MNVKLIMMIRLCVAVSLLVCLSAVHAAESHQSKYKGQEHRSIKTLSDDDIQELANGGGWGLAKAAELNGYPGPLHVLQMASEIALSPMQTEAIEKLYDEMKAEATVLGNDLIELERKLNLAFAEQQINDESLAQQLEKIGDVRTRLRLVHLSAHLKTPDILTRAQIDLYNKLRGYFADDPCKNIPEGHNETMWKKHNGCE